MPHSPLPVEARVVLAIAPHFDRCNDLVAPFWVTQKGISERCAIDRSNVAKALRALIASGVVLERRAIVEGEPRPMKVYFTTQAGQELSVRLAGPTMGRKVHPQGLVSPRGFLGRKRELDEIKGWSVASEPRALLIHGMPGIGKSSLLLRSADVMPAGAHIFFYVVRDGFSLLHLLRELAEFLSSCSRRELQRYLEGTGQSPLDSGIAFSFLMKDFVGLRAVLLLDDYQNATPELAVFVRGLLDALPRTEVRLLAAAERPFAPFDTRSIAGRKVRALNLVGLEAVDLGALAERKFGTPAAPAELERLLTLTGGNPLFLELLTDRSGEGAKGRLTEFVGSLLRTRLGERELYLLRVLAVFRRPAPERFVEPSEVEALESLIARSLVDRTASRTLTVHAVLAEVVRTSTPESQRREAHLAAARLYAGSERPEDRLESVWHLAIAGAGGEVVESLSTSCGALIGSGLARQVLHAIDALPAGAVKGALADPRMALVRGRCLFACGKAAAAVEILGVATRGPASAVLAVQLWEVLAECLVQLGETGAGERACRRGLRLLSGLRDQEARRRAELRLLKSLAALKRFQLRYRDAIAVLGKCLARAKGLGDTQEEIHCHNTIGISFLRLHEWTLARRSLDAALDLARRARASRREGSALNNLGILAISTGELDRALACFHDGLRIGERLGDLHLVAVCKENLSNVHSIRGEFHVSRTYLDSAVEIARATGNRRLLATCRESEGELHLLMGALERACVSLNESRSLAGALGDRDVALRSGRLLAEALARRGMRRECRVMVDECVRIARRFRQPGPGAEALYAIAVMHHFAGEEREAIAALRRAKSYYESDHCRAHEAARYFELSGRVQEALGGRHRQSARVAMSRAAEMYRSLGARAAASRCAQPGYDATRKPSAVAGGTVLHGLYLVYRSGLLLARYEPPRRAALGAKKEFVGEMLVAVQALAREAMGLEDTETLQTFTIGSRRLVVETGRHACLVADLEGREPARLRAAVRAALREFEADRGPLLEAWDGDMSKLAGAERMLERLAAGPAAAR